MSPKQGGAGAAPAPGLGHLRVTSPWGWGHSQGRGQGWGQAGRTPLDPPGPLGEGEGRAGKLLRQHRGWGGGTKLRGTLGTGRGGTGDRQSQLRAGHSAGGTGTQCPPAAPFWSQNLVAQGWPCPCPRSCHHSRENVPCPGSAGTALVWGWHHGGTSRAGGDSKAGQPKCPGSSGGS